MIKALIDDTVKVYKIHKHENIYINKTQEYKYGIQEPCCL